MKDKTVLGTRIDKKGNECSIIEKTDTNDGFEDILEVVHRIDKNGKTNNEYRKVQRCKHCGDIKVYYDESLNKTLLRSLFRLKNNDGTARVKDITYSNSEYNNFQKLQYFGLVFKDGHGTWYISDFGERFIRGDVACPKKIVHLGNEVVERSEPIFITECRCLPEIMEKDYYTNQVKEQL